MGSETGAGVFNNGDYDQIHGCHFLRRLIFGLQFEANMLQQPNDAPKDYHNVEKTPGKYRGLEVLATRME